MLQELSRKLLGPARIFPAALPPEPKALFVSLYIYQNYLRILAFVQNFVLNIYKGMQQ